MTTFLGIDLGSTSIKGALLDVERTVVESIRIRPFPAMVSGLPPAFYEVDPAAIVRATREVIRELAECGSRIAGVIVCSQMGGLILTDLHGNPQSNYLSWRDQRVLANHPARSDSFFDELRRRTTPRDLARIGNELRPGSAASLLFWLAETNSLPTGPLIAMHLGDYVLASLTGSEPKTEPTLALGTLNLDTGRIHHEWFEQLGYGGIRWPELVPVSQPVGRLPVGTSRVPCFPAVGDQQAALFGAEVALGELSLNISTGSQVSLMTETLQRGEYQTRPYFAGQFLNTITHLPAGRSLNALVDLLSELALAEGHRLRDPWGTISRAVEQVPASDLEVSLAFFAGTIGDSGHLRNMRLENLTVGQLFRAAFEHMADNYLQCAERLSPRQEWREVVVCGGLPQKLPSLRQAIAERFHCPLRFVNTAEETVTGLLRLAQNFASQEIGTHDTL